MGVGCAKQADPHGKLPLGAAKCGEKLQCRGSPQNHRRPNHLLRVLSDKIAAPSDSVAASFASPAAPSADVGAYFANAAARSRIVGVESRMVAAPSSDIGVPSLANEAGTRGVGKRHPDRAALPLGAALPRHEPNAQTLGIGIRYEIAKIKGAALGLASCSQSSEMPLNGASR